jgi:hypothetical protein
MVAIGDRLMACDARAGATLSTLTNRPDDPGEPPSSEASTALTSSATLIHPTITVRVVISCDVVPTR